MRVSEKKDTKSTATLLFLLNQIHLKTMHCLYFLRMTCYSQKNQLPRTGAIYACMLFCFSDINAEDVNISDQIRLKVGFNHSTIL